MKGILKHIKYSLRLDGRAQYDAPHTFLCAGCTHSLPSPPTHSLTAFPVLIHIAVLGALAAQHLSQAPKHSVAAS